MNVCVCVRVCVPLCKDPSFLWGGHTERYSYEALQWGLSGFWLADAKHCSANRIRGSYSDGEKRGGMVVVVGGGDIELYCLSLATRPLFWQSLILEIKILYVMLILLL